VRQDGKVGWIEEVHVRAEAIPAEPWSNVRDGSVEPLRAVRALRRDGATIYPEQDRIFAAFAVPFKKVRVVIVGLDPYPTKGHATGLAFSVPRSLETLPPGLRSIHEAMRKDGFEPPQHGDLSGWMNEGVLLLNRALTFEVGKKAGSHLPIWRDFTDDVIRSLGKRDEPVVFVLWGNDAQKVRGLIDEKHNWVVTAPHPSSRGAHRKAFQKSKSFSKVNTRLVSLGSRPIEWATALR
jgi:uracil-DNA glycosylase